MHESNLDYLNNCYTRLIEIVDYLDKSHADGKYNWIHLQCENSSGDNIDTIENIHNKIFNIIEKEVL